MTVFGTDFEPECGFVVPRAPRVPAVGPPRGSCFRSRGNPGKLGTTPDASARRGRKEAVEPPPLRGAAADVLLGKAGRGAGLPAWRRHGWATRPPVPFQQLGRSGATIRTPRKRLGSRRLFFFFFFFPHQHRDRLFHQSSELGLELG